MDNCQAARTVLDLAGQLKSQRASHSRVRAYRRAAAGLYRGELGGSLTNGRLQYRDELLARLSPPFRALLGIPGLGPRTAERLIREAGINGLADLSAAARRGDLRKLEGIGPDRERRFGAAAEALLARAA